MSKIEDGGPAFPKPLDPYPNVQGTASLTGAPSMSQRAYVAIKVLAGIGTWTPTYDINGMRHSGMVEVLYSPDALKARAEWAVAQADALIAALNSKEV